LKTTGFPKRALLAFVIALAAYAGLYYAIEHRRATKGPWQVTFTREQTGTPTIVINQPSIGITNVQISFAGSSSNLTNDPANLSFGEARRPPFDVPFGKCVFLDTVFLPGTIVFEIAGHQIQLMPRVLTIDGAERPWNSGESVSLTNKPAAAKSQ
jgi:hypothetical protein